MNNYGIQKDRLTIWGSGRPRREFLHADDLGRAVAELAEKIDFKDILRQDFQINNPEFPLTHKQVRNTHINIGTGKDISVLELAEMIKTIVGYKGEIAVNPEKPDGTFRKLLDVSKAKAFGIEAKINLNEGITRTYKNYIKARN